MSMAVDHSLNLKAGSIVQGKYEVVRCLGAGSMGMVYSVKHLELQGRMLAMKVLYSDVAKDEVQAARFRNEIVASYEVNHPNVVRAYDFFRENDLVAYTMEFVSGGDLADKLNEVELIKIPEIIHMLVEMASGVEAIHRAGIVHRDLKPENILLTTDGAVRITDFGIARNLKGPRLTDHGGIVGTFAYVAPEYLENGHVDEKSDIFSLGVLAYEMIVGEAPYNGENVIEEMHLRLTTDPTPPHELRSECPIELSNIVMKALARNPEERFQSARMLRKELFKLDRLSSRTSTIEYSRMREEAQPKVLQADQKDEDVSKLMSGLKQSLGVETEMSIEEPFFSGLDEIDQETEIQDTDSFSVATQVGISEGRISTERIRELEDQMQSKSKSGFQGVAVRVLDFVGSFLIVIMGLLMGLLLIQWMLPEVAEKLYAHMSGYL